MNRSVLAVGRTAQAIAEATFADLREDKFADGKLSLRLGVDSLEENWSVGKRIPALAIFLDLLIARDPIQGGGLRGDGGRREKEDRERY